MVRLVQRFIAALLCVTTGCAATPSAATRPTRTTLLVCGVFGDGPWYDGLRDALAADGSAADGSAVTTVAWGLPKPLFAMNFSTRSVHERAEADLAAKIDAVTGPLDLVGHSAGCGVILGALARVHRAVDRVALIAPSVSPGYDLDAALAHAGRVDAFVSDRDTVFLKWRCGTFGTYDGVKTPAAGYAGFATTRPSLAQHPYDPAWAALGNDGGHAGGTAKAFVAAVVVPTMNAGR